MLRFGATAMALVLLATAGASAQTEEELEEARALFAEGVQATREERWGEAAERFRRVMRVRATAQVKYNLALALSHTGELAEAAALLRDVVEDPDLPRRPRRHARRLLREIEPRLGRLTVRVQGDEVGLTVTLDGRPIGLDRLGSPIEVDPGAHRVALTRGGVVLGSRQVRVAEGESAEVALVATAVRRTEGEERELVVAEEPAVAPAAGGSVLEEWWFWTMVGAVVVAGVGIGVGVAMATSAPSPVQGNLSPGVLEVMLP